LEFRLAPKFFGARLFSLLTDQFSNMQLTGKVAVVTGASKGIGWAIGEALAMAGARVVLSSRKQEAVEESAKRLRDRGLEAVGIACNVGNPSEWQPLIEGTVAHYGALDILVNNAATNPVFGGIEFTDGGAFDKIMAVNVKGPFELSKLALPHMRARGGGSIVNIASVGGISPEPQLGIYSVSKAALISLTKTMAKEWGVEGIRANVVCPGLIRTKFSEALWANEPLLRHVLEGQPIERIGTPEEVAALVRFLVSPESSYCTGGVYTVDGGYTI
jgi:NAD(P)-dependent dehydrogenase (short-subunit alcohol dehydrogenase family)